MPVRAKSTILSESDRQMRIRKTISNVCKRTAMRHERKLLMLGYLTWPSKPLKATPLDVGAEGSGASPDTTKETFVEDFQALGIAGTLNIVEEVDPKWSSVQARRGCSAAGGRDPVGDD